MSKASFPSRLRRLIGSGSLETKDYAFASFTEVEVSSVFAFEIQQSSSYKISVTADDNIMDYVQVSMDGQALKIELRTDPRRSTILSLGPVTLRASVTMPQLRCLTVSGASRGEISGFSSTDNVSIKLSGASRVTGDITAGSIEFDIDGASTIQLGGSANDMVANVDGAGRFNLKDFTVNDAHVHLSGASSGTINLNGKLDADLSGVSKLSCVGEPEMGDINTSGKSTVSKN